MRIYQPLLFLALLAASASAAEPADPAQVAQTIDKLIEQPLAKANLQSAGPADDAEFLRRATLDLTGRIPTLEQVNAYLGNTNPGRRAQLIEELLASPAHAEHLARTWRELIAPDELPNDGNGGGLPVKQVAAFTQWLTTEFQANERWPRIVEKILLAQGAQPQAFYYALVGNVKGEATPEGAARGIAANFLGVQIHCAECHNDPFKAWKQSDFWGAAAFFSGTRGGMGRLEEKAYDGNSNTNVPKTKQNPPGPKIQGPAIAVPKTALKNVGAIYPARFLDGQVFADDKPQQLRPVFVKWAAALDNPYFGPAFVNRLWNHFFARGLVEPVDDFRPDNPASHPELLDLLTREFRASGGDVRHLIRCIVLTRAYQRTSRTAGLKNPEETLRLFGRMRLKVQSAEVLYDSLKIALAEKEIDLRTVDGKPRNVGAVEAALVRDAQYEFVKLFRTNKYDAADFTHDIPQMLALLNHPRLHTGGQVVPKLLAEKLSADDAVMRLYLTALARRPSAVELTEAKAFAAVCNDPRLAYNELLWSLICRSEFLLIR